MAVPRSAISEARPPSLNGLAESMLNPRPEGRRPAPGWPVPSSAFDADSLDRSNVPIGADPGAAGPAVPTGPWGRPPGARLRPGAAAAPPVSDRGQRSLQRWSPPPPAPPPSSIQRTGDRAGRIGTRVARRRPLSRRVTAILEAVVALALIGGLAAGFGSSRPPGSEQVWAARASPVIGALLADVAALTPQVFPGAPSTALASSSAALGRDLTRAGAVGAPPDSARRDEWANALNELRSALLALGAGTLSDPGSAAVRAQLTAAGDGLLALSQTRPGPSR